MEQRFHLLKQWLQDKFPQQSLEIISLVNDASFRRYFRVLDGRQSWIAMDAPPQHEDSQPFVTVAQAFAKRGLRVPQIVDKDLMQGFLLLEDFGDRLYLQELNNESVDHLYATAFAALLKLQKHAIHADEKLPRFDEAFIRRELELLQAWFLDQHLGIPKQQQPQTILDDLFQLLVSNSLEQPQVCVHRDFHSRNLMVLEKDAVGILDFQDAVSGPVSYDLVSLLRDCYIAWPKERVRAWVSDYWQHASEVGILQQCSSEQFQRWFDLTGLQRHLRILGTFSRLYYRDGKSRYIADMPRIINYVLEVNKNYPELTEFHQWLTETALPRFAAHRELV